MSSLLLQNHPAIPGLWAPFGYNGLPFRNLVSSQLPIFMYGQDFLYFECCQLSPQEVVPAQEPEANLGEDFCGQEQGMASGTWASRHQGIVWDGRNLKFHLISSPAMGKDVFHYLRCLQAPSSLVWDTPRDGAAPGSPCPWLCSLSQDVSVAQGGGRE